MYANKRVKDMGVEETNRTRRERTINTSTVNSFCDCEWTLGRYTWGPQEEMLRKEMIWQMTDNLLLV